MISAHSLEHMAQAGAAAILQVTGQHGTAGAEDCRNIQASGSHQKARHVFITVGDHHQAVKLMGHDHGFRGIGDQIPGHQGVFHTNMTHGDAVANSDGREHNRRASGGTDACLDGFGNFVNVHVAGNNLVIRADDAHQGPLNLFLRQAQCKEKAAVRGAFHAVFDLIGKHRIPPCTCIQIRIGH